MSSPGEMWSSRSSTWPIAGRENTISITIHISKHFSLSPSVFSYPLPGGESKTQVLDFSFPSYSTSTTCTVAVFHDDVNLRLLQWPTVNIVLKRRYNKMARSEVWRPLHRSDLDVGRGETFTDGEKQQSVDLIAREAKTLHDHPIMELKPELQNLQRTTSRT
ncbi:hypothetical protein Bca101_070613 [Brassica carinata]